MGMRLVAEQSGQLMWVVIISLQKDAVWIVACWLRFQGVGRLRYRALLGSDQTRLLIKIILKAFGAVGADFFGSQGLAGLQIQCIEL